jgi:hypothetical protein
MAGPDQLLAAEKEMGCGSHGRGVNWLSSVLLSATVVAQHLPIMDQRWQGTAADNR